jgi:hypothetical protein
MSRQSDKPDKKPKPICPRCHNTGTWVRRIGRYNYGFVCKHGPVNGELFDGQR